MTGPVPALAPLDPQAGVLRLPHLPRPPGSRALSEAQLCARATQLWLSQLAPQSHVASPQAAVAPMALAAASARQTSPMRAGSPGVAEPPARAISSPAASRGSAAAPWPGAAASCAATPSRPQPVPSPTPASAPSARVRLLAPLWAAAPWLIVLAGALALLPWLIWAPLAGGLCLGLLLIQGGMLRRWLAARESEPTPSGQAAQPVVLSEEPGPVAAVTAAGPSRLRIADPGWMLAGVLVLLLLQVAMLLTIGDLKRPQGSSFAAALRDAQQSGEVGWLARLARPGSTYREPVRTLGATPGREPSSEAAEPAAAPEPRR